MATLEIGTRVKVYYNLRLKCLSVLTYNRDLKRWLLHSHCKDLALKDIKFKVSEAGRKRVLKEHQKNVHAYVIGIVCETQEIKDDWYVARYNPYLNESFVWRDHPIHRADVGQFKSCRLFVG